MFIFIPLILIAVSLFGIGFIILPKLRVLKNDDKSSYQLEPGQSFWRLMLPELFSFIDRIDFKSYKKAVLTDIEKFLRRIKILSLKIDNSINRWLEQRPKISNGGDFSKVKVGEEEKTEDNINKERADKNNSVFKNKEKELITKISQNPKDKELYKTLGALYLEYNDLLDAKAVFDVVLELDPNDKEAKEALKKLV